MILRVVKMTFQPEQVEAFLAIFNQTARKIRAFPGCLQLQLWRDSEQGHIWFTLSEWQNGEALEAYRNSAFFGETWGKVKKLFADKPQAWSLTRHDSRHKAPTT